MKVFIVLFARNLIFVFLIMLYSECKHDPDIANIRKICFDKEVLPIIQSNCTMSHCHGSDSERDMDLRFYNGISKLIKSGDPYDSELYSVITSSWLDLMPPAPNAPLTKDQRTLIYLWIKQGGTQVCDNSYTTNPLLVSGDTVCFTSDILPVFISNCTVSNCHDATSHVEGYNFTSFNSITSKGIIPGNAAGSKVYSSLIASGEDLMPPLPRSGLSSLQINNIKKWINQGAQNTYCNSNCDTNLFTFSGTIGNIIQTYCTGCHSGANPAFGVSLVTYNDIKTIATNGLLIKVLYNLESKPLMPPGSPLIACKKTQIKKWVNASALNN